MKQPDTTTRQGRHQVEDASETKRIQAEVYGKSNWDICYKPGPNQKFNWVKCKHRIHPDDLLDRVSKPFSCDKCGSITTLVTVEGVDSTHAYCVTCTRQTPMKVYPTAQPTIDPGEGYRLLKEDEKVQKGDQYYNYYNDGWKETNALDRGVVGLGWVYRRKIEQKWHCGCCSTQYEEKLNHIYPPHAEVQLKCINCKTFVNHRQKSIDKTTPPKPKTFSLYCKHCGTEARATSKQCIDFIKLQCRKCNCYVVHSTVPPKPKRYRKWTMDEVPVGMKVRYKTDHDSVSEIGWQKSGVIGIFGNCCSPNYLLEHCEQLDGTPCGKLEE